MAAPGNHVLQVDDLGFGYGAERLFDGVSFSLASGDRLALVAPNGAGKSTLLRILAGEIAPDAGRVVARREAKLGFYRQSHELDAEVLAADPEVMDAFLSGFQDVVRLRHELHEAREQLGHAVDPDAALARLSRLEDAYHVAHGDDLERRIEMLAHKLGFGDADLGRSVTSLSGGERGRLLLGTVLAQEPDLLLLDEPTNHLDLETIGWLEDHLRAFRGAALIVSHDRRFLDRVTTQTAELGRRTFRLYPVSYGRYVEQREEDLARERALAERQQAFVDKTEDFIRKNIAGQKTKQAQSRRKMLEKLDTLERPEDIWAQAGKLRVRFAEAPRSGDIVLECTGLGAARGGRVLFSGLDLLVRRGERVGVVGPNGAGKTTLMKLLAGRSEVPLAAAAPKDPKEGDGTWDCGAVRRGTNLRDGYFDQHLGELDPRRTAVEEIRSIRGDLNVDGARSYLARFRITGDDALRVVSGFSGGERSRLALAKLLLEPRNLLFLDEPTNHLDIPACEILEEALSTGFDGTLVLVSHDRQFLETVTTRLVVVRDGKAEVFSGGYREWAESLDRPARPSDPLDDLDLEDMPGWTVGGAPQGRGKAEPSRPPPASPQRSEGEARRAAPGGEVGKREHDARKAASRELERKRKRVEELEKEISVREAELAALRATLSEDPKGDWAALAEKAERERAASRTLETMVEEWTRLSESLSESGTGQEKAGA